MNRLFPSNPTLTTYCPFQFPVRENRAASDDHCCNHVLIHGTYPFRSLPSGQRPFSKCNQQPTSFLPAADLDNYSFTNLVEFATINQSAEPRVGTAKILFPCTRRVRSRFALSFRKAELPSCRTRNIGIRSRDDGRCLHCHRPHQQLYTISHNPVAQSFALLAGTL